MLVLISMLVTSENQVYQAKSLVFHCDIQAYKEKQASGNLMFMLMSLYILPLFNLVLCLCHK